MNIIICNVNFLTRVNLPLNKNNNYKKENPNNSQIIIIIILITIRLIWWFELIREVYVWALQNIKYEIHPKNSIVCFFSQEKNKRETEKKEEDII